jgi:hypothetical protein
MYPQGKYIYNTGRIPLRIRPENKAPKGAIFLSKKNRCLYKKSTKILQGALPQNINPNLFPPTPSPII